MNNRLSVFPAQKVPDSIKRTEKWQQDCLDAADTILRVGDDFLRQSFKNKYENYNLFNGKVNPQYIEKILNVHKINNFNAADTFQHIGLGRSKIMLLVGEESKRRNDMRVLISSRDQVGISMKEDKIRDMWYQQLIKIIQSSGTKEEIEKNLRKYEKYLKYDFQDINEINAQRLIQYHSKKLNINHKFTQSFMDALISSEEIMYVGEEGNDVVVDICDPKHMARIGGGSSYYIEDSDMIIRYDYKSIGQVFDLYYDYLTPKQRDILLDFQGTGGRNLYGYNIDRPLVAGPGDFQIYAPSEFENFSFSNAFDERGNIRVTHCVWRSKREISELSFIDELGIQQTKFVDSKYIPDTFSGETVRKVWVNEWWEGTKIGMDIYVKVRPIPYVGKSLVNASLGTPPYVGTIYGFSNMTAQSLMDLMKPLDIGYSILHWKREQEIASHFGSVLAVNLSMIPQGWNPEKWMDYIIRKKFMLLDPTQEIMKGPSQGKSAGMFNTMTATPLNFDNSGTIGMLTEIMRDYEDKLGKISGVSGAREGNTTQHETVGNANREVVQTSHITELWFNIHDNFKKRVYEKLLSVAKYVFKKNPIKAQHIFDDMGIVWLQNSEDFADYEYDVHLSNSSKDTEAFQSIKELFHAAMQNGEATLSDIAEIYSTESTGELIRKLKEAKDRLAEQQEIQAQQQNEQIKLEADLLEQSKDKDVDREIRVLEAKYNFELIKETAIKELELMMQDDSKSEIEREKLNLMKEALNAKFDEVAKKFEIEREKMKQDLKKHNDKLVLENKKINKASAIKRN